MKKSALKFNTLSIQLLMYFLAVFILLLSYLNIKNYLAPKKVLGIKTEKVDTQKFWGDFVAKNPDYVPGWLELGKTDKAKEIDPNYF